MTTPRWTYPADFLEALAGFGLAPRPDTPPRFARDQINDLYRYEIRRLRERLLAGKIVKQGYVPLVIALRKKYWVLSLTPEGWERIIVRSDF